MAHIIEMPKLSDDMTVGTIGRWLKKEGDVVKSGEALADVETDKATLELESHYDGVLLKRFVGEGAKVPVDSPICAIGNPGETIEIAGTNPQGPSTRLTSGVREASVPVTSPVFPPSGEFKQAPAKEKPAASAGYRVSNPSIAASLSSVTQAGRTRISPLARKLAREKDIDPTTVTGSGPRGRILRKDILAAEAKRPSTVLTSPEVGRADLAPVSAEQPISTRAAMRPDRVVPNSPMRAAIARRLVESKTQIPHFYLETEVDVASLLALRNQLNAALENEGVRISVNDFMLKASAFALRKVPEVNSSWEGTSIRYHQNVHVSFAVAIDEGLITPVVGDTDTKSMGALSRETRALAMRAKEKKLSPSEYTGGTFCVTNLGMMGITRFSAIINPPNVAILAVGATVRKPVVQADQVVIGDRLTLTLSCDHRVVDGALGATFLNEVRGFLESPLRLLCDPPRQTNL